MRWRSIARDFRGPFWHQFPLPPEIKNAHRLSAALVEITKRWPVYEKCEPSDVAPVFILSAGWGAGSTLMQRLIMSSGEVLVWGEPLDQAAIIQRMGMMVSSVRNDWPPEYHDINSKKLADLSEQWVVNLAPSLSSLRSAHRAMLKMWLEISDANDGVERWGLKKVRLTIDHARYLKWLFPCAKLFFSTGIYMTATNPIRGPIGIVFGRGTGSVILLHLRGTGNCWLEVPSMRTKTLAVC